MKLMHKIYFVSGSLTLILILVFVFYFESNASLNNGNIQKTQYKITNNEARNSNPLKQIRVSFANLTINRVSDNDSDVHVTFNVINPTEGTLILEEIQYNIIVQNTKLASGSIGQKLEGFLTPSADIFPIIGNSSIVLKDRKVVNRDNFDSTIWNIVERGTFNVIINGTISYKSTTGLESNRSEENFRFIVPIHQNH